MASGTASPEAGGLNVTDGTKANNTLSVNEEQRREQRRYLLKLFGRTSAAVVATPLVLSLLNQGCNSPNETFNTAVLDNRDWMKAHAILRTQMPSDPEKAVQILMEYCNDSARDPGPGQDLDVVRDPQPVCNVTIQRPNAQQHEKIVAFLGRVSGAATGPKHEINTTVDPAVVAEIRLLTSQAENATNSAFTSIGGIVRYGMQNKQLSDQEEHTMLLRVLKEWLTQYDKEMQNVNARESQTFAQAK